MTLAELKSEVVRRVNDNLNATDVFTDSEITQSLNNGYDELGDSTEFNEVNETYTVTGALYDDLYNPSVLSKPFLTLKHVFNTANNLWLEPWEYRKLDQSFSRWETLFSLSWKFILRGLSYFSGYPRQIAGTTYQMYYTAMPTHLSALTDEPQFPREFHLGLVCYATFELLARKQEVKKAMNQWSMFVEYQTRLFQYVRSRQSQDGAATFGMPSSSRNAYEATPYRSA